MRSLAKKKSAPFRLASHDRSKPVVDGMKTVYHFRKEVKPLLIRIAGSGTTLNMASALEDLHEAIVDHGGEVAAILTTESTDILIKIPDEEE